MFIVVFDKGKSKEIKDKVLFIDTRNYYTVVDRTSNEWSEWQLKNINAIVWLYRGEVDKYTNLLNEYRTKLGSDISFTEKISEYIKKIKKLKKEAKEANEAAGRIEKKEIREKYEIELAEITELLTIAKEANWLYEKFGDGVYADILGLCKVATISEIKDKDWSLTPRCLLLALS